MNPALPKVLLTVTLACWLPASSAVRLQKGVGGGAVTGEAPESAVVEQAIASIVGASSPTDIREMFDRHLRLRGEAVPASDKPKYWRELRAKPELARTTIYGADSPQSQAVLKIIRPALTLYGRDWDVAVIEQGAPFTGTFRQCIFIVSTGLLRLVTDAELRGFVAHELAHECFIEELREADRSHCASAYRLVEYKSDLVAALALLLARGDPLALASGVDKVEAYYNRNEPSVLRDDTHPDSAHRRHGIELFLTRIRRLAFSRPEFTIFEVVSAVGRLRPDDTQNHKALCSRLDLGADSFNHAYIYH